MTSESENHYQGCIPYINVLTTTTSHTAASALFYCLRRCGREWNRRVVPFLDTSCKKAILSGEKGYYDLHHSGAAFQWTTEKASWKNFSQWKSVWRRRTAAARENHWWKEKASVPVNDEKFSLLPLVAIRQFSISLNSLCFPIIDSEIWWQILFQIFQRDLLLLILHGWL